MAAVGLYAGRAGDVQRVEAAAFQGEAGHSEDDEAAVADRSLNLISAGRYRKIAGDFFVADIVGNDESAVSEAKIQTRRIESQVDKTDERFAAAG